MRANIPVCLTIVALLCNVFTFGNDHPLIFPLPSEILIHDGQFVVDASTSIIIPENGTRSDRFLADFFRHELIDRYGLPVGIVAKTKVSSTGKFILIGALSNPLVRQYCDSKKLTSEVKKLGEEGYILSVNATSVVIAANSSQGALLGLSSLRQIVQKDQSKLHIPQLVVKDSPAYSFRGIKLYLPGRENITFFKRFVKDFVTLFKFNTIILELNANMRLTRHPELNVGAVEFSRHLNFNRLDRPPGVHQEYQNSSHQDNADGQILEKKEVLDLVNYIREFNIEIIPELPSLTHSYYLLPGKSKFAENPHQEYPDTYCPLKPGVYDIYFDVLDEYIEVIRPSIIHVGHDEWRMEKDLCALCKGKDYGQLYADDLNKIHDHLAKKGIKTAIWGDHLLESVTKKDHQVWKTKTGYEYKIPGALAVDQVRKLIPKDILVFNWFWDSIDNDRNISDFGFQQVYGNLLPGIGHWKERGSIKGLLGGAPSSWAATTEYNIGKDQLYDFLGVSNMLWSQHHFAEDSLAFIVEPLIHQIYLDLSGQMLPGDYGLNVSPLDIERHYNCTLNEDVFGLARPDFLKGNLNGQFHLPSVPAGGKKAVCSSSTQTDPASSTNTIPINRDVSSVLFLHACALEGSNKKAYDAIYNFEDTAELLGWYEITYEDGFVMSVPIRYGVNILDLQWKRRISEGWPDKVKYNQNKYAYRAEALDCSKKGSEPATFFSFEWVNTRFGKKIRGIELKEVEANNANRNPIILIGLSVTHH